MRLILAALAFALLGTVAAFAQAQQGDPYLDMIATQLQLEPEGVRISETAARGEAIISMPVSHRRTGVLREPMRFRGGLRNGAIYIPAGAHGYFAGEFTDQATGARMPVWCFTSRPVDADAPVACAIQSNDSESGWRVALEPSHRYLPISFSLSPRGTPVDAPQVEERPVAMHPDLRAEYRLRGWSRRAANVELHLAGADLLARGVYRPMPRGEDGSAVLETPYGRLRLIQDGDGARIERLPTSQGDAELSPTPERGSEQE